jgi:ribosomal protein L11 methyltransferase
LYTESALWYSVFDILRFKNTFLKVASAVIALANTGDSPKTPEGSLDGELSIHYSPNSMSNNFVEVSIRADVDSGELLARLQDGETLGCWENDGVIHIFWSVEKWTPAALEDLKRVLSVMGIELGSTGLAIQEVPDQDWNAAWTASLQPIRLGQRIRIRQSWHSSDPAFDGIELVIDPKRAFGTGYHATTQLVIEWLENQIHGGERVLDVGTGSGILSMAAIRLGAASALAIDNDPVAVDCAREYADNNGFGGELELRTVSFDNLGPDGFDVIVANIDGQTLPRFCSVMPQLLKATGVACLSGLQAQDYEEIHNALAKNNFHVRSRFGREDWLALVVSR